MTALLAAPNVKAVRAQTMFNDSYVFVIFEDGTDIYWARSRVVEYLQTIAGRLPADVHPAIGPDATGAGWVYEYVLVDHSHKYSLADLRTIQDWHLRYQLETVPGVAEVASIGGFVRQYQVNVDPNKLLAYGISLSTVIDRVKSSTNEVGGRVLELSGTRYMIRGLGYLKSLGDLENVPVMAKNGTPVLIKDLGRVSFGPDMREGVAEWQGEGETVGGIVVMRPLEWQMTAAPVPHAVIPVLAERGGTQLQAPRPTLLVDTREQNPFNFSRFRGWFAGVEKKALLLGDYSIAGLEDVCVVERKDLSDLVHSCTVERTAFIKRLRLMAQHPHRLLVITSTLSQVKSPYAHTSVDPNRTTQFLIAVLAGLQVPFVCSETHELGEELVGSYLYQIHLYHWLESNDYGRSLSDSDL